MSLSARKCRIFIHILGIAIISEPEYPAILLLPPFVPDAAVAPAAADAAAAEAVREPAPLQRREVGSNTLERDMHSAFKLDQRSFFKLIHP